MAEARLTRSELRKQIKEEGKEEGKTGEDLQSWVKEEFEIRWAELKAEIERERQEAKEKEERKRQEAKEEADRLLELEKEKIRVTAETERAVKLKEAELNAREKNGPDTDSLSSDPQSLTSLAHSPLSFPLEAYDDKRETIDKFLDRFERSAKQYELPMDKYTFKLAQALRDRAYDVYLGLPSDKQTDYDALKQALLEHYELTAEAYRRKFRNARKERGETFERFADRSESYLQKWIRLTDSKMDLQGLTQLVLLEQFRDSLQPEIRLFAAEHGAVKLTDYVRLADRYISAHARENKPSKPSDRIQVKDGKPQGNLGNGTGTVTTHEAKPRKQITVTSHRPKARG